MVDKFPPVNQVEPPLPVLRCCVAFHPQEKLLHVCVTHRLDRDSGQVLPSIIFVKPFQGKDHGKTEQRKLSPVSIFKTWPVWSQRISVRQGKWSSLNGKSWQNMKQKEIVLHLDCSPRHPKSVWIDIGFICSLPEMSLPVNQIEGIMGSWRWQHLHGNSGGIHEYDETTAACHGSVFSLVTPLKIYCNHCSYFPC